MADSGPKKKMDFRSIADRAFKDGAQKVTCWRWEKRLGSACWGTAKSKGNGDSKRQSFGVVFQG